MGVRIPSSLKVATQINRVVNAFDTLSFISQAIEFGKWGIKVTIVQAIGETSILSPSCRMDNIKLERVKKRIARMLRGVQSLT